MRAHSGGASRVSRQDADRDAAIATQAARDAADDTSEAPAAAPSVPA